MRVLCRHGHIAFYPRNESEAGRFGFIYGESLVRDKDFYTFAALKGLPRYSIKGKDYEGITATKTFEGEPWEVLKENGFVYSLSEGNLVAKTSISIFINPPEAGYFWLADSVLIQPGSQNKLGERVLSYDGEFELKTSSFYVFEVSYE